MANNKMTGKQMPMGDGRELCGMKEMKGEMVMPKGMSPQMAGKKLAARMKKRNGR